MEMSENGIEHQATVDKGLKMKIKRKPPGSKVPETKARSANEESNKLAKNTGTCIETMPEGGDSKPIDDDRGSVSSDGLAQKSQKRKRNNKSGKSREADASEKPNNDAENRVKGRDLCQYSRNRDAIGCAVERSSNRKRAISAAQELGSNSTDQQQQQQTLCSEDKELLNKISSKNLEYCSSTSVSGSEKSDFTCTPPEAAAADGEKLPSAHSSDPYEFALRLEDLQQVPAKKFKSEKMDSEMSSSSSSSSTPKTKCDSGTVTYNVGVMTDPECLGACEPGTHVVLEGIVWCESNNGILVVNVTWRGKTYVGTLMDATKHHWASPRFREESPSADLDYRVQKPKRGTPVMDITEGRRLRKCRRTGPSNNGHSGNGASKTMVTRQSPPINSETNGRQRGRALDQLTEATCDLANPSKKTKLDLEASDESFFKCIAPDCSKKFKHISGLRYHQSHAHKKQSYVWMQKPEIVMNSDLPVQDKCKNVKRNDESAAKSGNGAVEASNQVIDHRIGNVSAVTDFPEPETVTKEGSQTVVKADMNFPLPAEVIKTNDDHEQILTSSDADVPSPQWPAVSVVSSLAMANESVTKQVVEALAELPKHSAMEDLKRMTETGKTNEPSKSRSPSVAASYHTAAKNVAETAKPDLKTDLPSSNVISDLTDKTKTRPNEVEAEHPSRADVSSSPAADIFHKPILRTPEIGKHRIIHQASDKSSANARIENGQPLTTFRPQNIGLKLSPSGDCNNEDKSPAYSDISDANDGAFSESEMRLRKADKELKRAQKAEKPHIRKYEDFSSPGLHPNSNFKQSSFPMPATASPSPLTASSHSTIRKPNEGAVKPRDVESDQGRKLVSIMPSSKTGAVGAKPVTPGSDRQRTEKSNQPSDFNMEILQARENGRLWMEMIQRSNMMPYGYAVDPLAHVQMMASNREYRDQYERWYMGQQYYRQLLQAESDHCAAGDKPVDMSAKSVSSVSTSSSDSVPFYAKSKASLKLPSRPAGSGIEDHASSEKHRESICPTTTQNCLNDFGKSVIYNHHEKSVSSRDKLLVPKQEPVRQRASEKDEKPIDLMHSQSGINKVKGKQLDGVNFVASSPSTLSKTKAPSAISSSSSNMSAHQTSQVQDYPKSSLPQMRYDANFAPFAAYSNPSFLDSSLSASIGSTPSSASVGLTGRYHDLNSKHPSLGSHDKSVPGHSPSVAPTRKSGSLATPLSSKELSPTEKNESRRQPMDGFDFTGNEGSLQDKPSTSSSSGHGSPLTLRHLHTHHHTHLVGPYPIYGSYSGLMSPVPTIVPPVVPVIPPTYIPK